MSEEIKNNFLKELEGLKELSLPENDYAIYGSGPMAIRGIREARDVDIIIRDYLWGKLKDKYKIVEEEGIKHIQAGNFELYKEWHFVDDLNPLIDTAETIECYKFVKIEHVLKWKEARRKEKDIRDIKLINDFQKI